MYCSPSSGTPIKVWNLFRYGEKTNMATLNGFRVTVPEAKEEDNSGYVVLRHGQNFRISLHNGHKYEGRGVPSDAEVYVQGNYVGTYRIPAGQTIILEHPIEDSGKFTAYRNGSNEAQQIGLDQESDDNGLIKVVWKPGNYKVRQIPVVVNWLYSPPTWTYRELDNYYDDGHSHTITYSYNTMARSSTCSSSKSCYSNSSNNLVGGGIGLSGHSEQTFTETDALEYVESDTVIYLRIAFRDEEPRPIKPVYKVHSTSVPRPLK